MKNLIDAIKYLLFLHMINKDLEKRNNQYKHPIIIPKNHQLKESIKDWNWGFIIIISGCILFWVLLVILIKLYL
jgi:ABC-type uncharacterized transport system permease subunit